MRKFQKTQVITKSIQDFSEYSKFIQVLGNVSKFRKIPILLKFSTEIPNILSYKEIVIIVNKRFIRPKIKYL